MLYGRFFTATIRLTLGGKRAGRLAKCAAVAAAAAAAEEEEEEAPPAATGVAPRSLAIYEAIGRRLAASEAPR